MYFSVLFHYFDVSSCLVDILYIFDLFLFNNFISSIGVECVHDLGSSCQFVIFLEIPKVFMSAKGSIYFLKIKYQGS